MQHSPKLPTSKLHFFLTYDPNSSDVIGELVFRVI